MKFTFYAFEVIPLGCPSTLTYELKDTNVDASANLVSSPAGLDQPISATTPHQILPSDDNALNTYSFYLKVTANGVFSYYQYLGPYSLSVTCSSDNSLTVVGCAGMIINVQYTKNVALGSI